MIKTSSVKTEVWRLILVPALSVTLLLAATLTYLYTSQLAGFMNERGRLLAEKTSHLAHIALSEANPHLLQEIISATLEEPHVRAVHIFEAQKQAHHHWGPQFLTEGEDKPSMASTGQGIRKTASDAMRFSFPITDKTGAEQIGTLEIELVTSPFRVLLYQTLLLVVLATIACLLLATYLAIKLHHKITDPVGHIQKVVHKLTKGQLNSRANTRLPYELAQLSHAINAMAEQLEQDQQEMQGNINQSMDDLRETMETIEIQNIELDIARKEALAASRIKSEFLANTSHEIRTPLNGIIGFTNLTLKTSLDNQQRSYLQTIQDSATNLLKIINDILDFSKIESGKLVLDYLPLPLRQTIEQAVESLAFDSQEKNIQIVTVIDNNIPPQLMGDPQRLKQLISNLLGNAIKFSPRGTVSITAELVEFEENQIILKVTVTDEGIGLDEETQKILFSSFTQADSSASRKHSGAGLGLAICKGLVQRMNGEIGVSSKLNQGTSFWFTVRMDVDSNFTAPEQNALKDKNLLICAEKKINYLQLQSLTESWQASTLWIESIHELFPTLRKQQQSGQNCHLLILDIAPEERKLPPRLLSNIAEQLDNEFSCKMIVCCTPAHMQLFQHHNTDRPLSFVKKPITQNELLGAINSNLDIQADPKINQCSSPPTKISTDKKVLVVDDNKANLQLAAELLKGLAIDTTQAISGDEAIEHFSEKVFDAVFMDIQMPGMDGLEATRRLRLLDQQRNRRTPIIALTAHSLTEQKTDLLLAGFDDCLKKPVDESQLAHVLNRWTGANTYRSPQPRITAIAVAEEKIDIYQPVSIGQCLSLANHKPDLARDMLAMLIEGLADDKRAICEALNKEHYSELQEHIHRLYGSSCYCGVPILRSLTGLLDKMLQSGQYNDITQVVICIEKSIDEIVDWAENNDINTIFSEKDLASNG